MTKKMALQHDSNRSNRLPYEALFLDGINVGLPHAALLYRIFHHTYRTLVHLQPIYLLHMTQYT
jgi:hypothetical protein